MKFFITKNEIKYVNQLKKDLNTLNIFSKKDKEILGPIYERELEKLNKKWLPFGIRINDNRGEKIF